MKIQSHRISKKTKGGCDILDITPDAELLLGRSKVRNGTAHFFIAGRTAGLTTVEYEAGLIRDLEEMFERLVPRGAGYAHNDAWHDGNGFSHVRTSLLKPSLTAPILEGRFALGTWQQVVLIDFDNRPRSREVILQFIGEE